MIGVIKRHMFSTSVQKQGPCHNKVSLFILPYTSNNCGLQNVVEPPQKLKEFKTVSSLANNIQFY